MYICYRMSFNVKQAYPIVTRSVVYWCIVEKLGKIFIADQHHDRYSHFGQTTKEGEENPRPLLSCLLHNSPSVFPLEITLFIANLATSGIAVSTCPPQFRHYRYCITSIQSWLTILWVSEVIFMSLHIQISFLLQNNSSTYSNPQPIYMKAMQTLERKWSKIPIMPNPRFHHCSKYQHKEELLLDKLIYSNSYNHRNIVLQYLSPMME